jgi:hypothetical protein
MININDGGPAFPCEHKFGDGSVWKHEGVSIRDYFAAKALQGLISEPSIKATAAEFATQAYRVADAMMKARES